MKKAPSNGRHGGDPPRRFRLYSDLVPVIERLLADAKKGDASAAATLVEGARIMALSVECLFKDSREAEEIVKRLAAETLLWPVVASPINEEHGPEWIRDYLEKLNLGAALNVSPRKRDHRTTNKDRVAVVHLMRLAEQHGHAFTRAGIKDRNAWKKSEFGKAAKTAIKEGLELYEEEGWINSKILAPITARARETVERERRRRNGLDRHEAVSVSTRTIKTAFFDEALSLIHGMLRE